MPDQAITKAAMDEKPIQAVLSARIASARIAHGSVGRRQADAALALKPGFLQLAGVIDHIGLRAQLAAQLPIVPSNSTAVMLAQPIGIVNNNINIITFFIDCVYFLTPQLFIFSEKKCNHFCC